MPWLPSSGASPSSRTEGGITVVVSPAPPEQLAGREKRRAGRRMRARRTRSSKGDEWGRTRSGGGSRAHISVSTPRHFYKDARRATCTGQTPTLRPPGRWSRLLPLRPSPWGRARPQPPAPMVRPCPRAGGRFYTIPPSQHQMVPPGGAPRAGSTALTSGFRLWGAGTAAAAPRPCPRPRRRYAQTRLLAQDGGGG